MSETDLLASCMETLRQLDYDRYLACLFAAREDRLPLFALHSFNAELGRIRESVSEPMLGEIRLTWWSEAVDGLAKNQVRKHPVIEALAGPVNAGNIDAEALLRMIDTRAQDLYEEAPADSGGMLAYAKGTGGALLQEAARCAGGDEPMRAVAADLGAAVTQAGIVRSIGFHASMRRVHLPADALETIGVSPESLFQGDFTPGISDLADRLGMQALDALRLGLKMAMSRRLRRALVPAFFAYLDVQLAQRYSFDPQKMPSGASRGSKLARSWWYVQTGRL